MRFVTIIITAVLGCSLITCVSAQEPHHDDDEARHGRHREMQDADTPPTPAPETGEAEQKDDEKDAEDYTVTHHSVTVRGRTLDYTATTGTVTLAEEDGKEKANVFFMAYTLDAVDDTSTRPVTFCFNGGPGSSSVWLHLGAFGPRRVEMGDAGDLLPPPWRLVPNEATLLDVTDLVFIDPVTTGYSRAVPGESPSQFHGVQEDIRSVGDFIRLYTTRFQRWSSPKFLAGESYGTTRAAGLAEHLQERHGLYLNGIVLVSSILHFQTTRSDSGNDLPHLLFLPTCTATAWYHGRLPRDLQQRPLPEVLDEVERFALQEYNLALAQGADLSADDESRVARTLARYLGVSEEFVRQNNLRVSMGRFVKELLRDDRRTVGRLDSRFKGIDRDAGGSGYEYDPSYAAIQGPFTATLYDYVRTELEYESDLTYEILTGRVQPWNYGSARNRYLNVADSLREAMTKNQDLKVFVASGYYDFATPYFATDYTFSHLGLEPELRDHVTIRYYESGHMMYIHDASRAKLKRELEEFYANAQARRHGGT